MVRRLILSVVFVLAHAAAAAALDCRHATPLPDDVRLVPPTSDVAADVARFAGVWSGAWTDQKGSEGQCTALVVEEVFANGYARSIYSIGTSPSLGAGIPNVWRVTGRIETDVLRFTLPVPGGGRLAYRIDSGHLSATYNDSGGARLVRVADPAALACRRDARAATAAPATAVRDRITRDELLTNVSQPPGPVHNNYFVPVGAAGPARHALRGTLTVSSSSLPGARLGCASRTVAIPAFTVAFLTDGERLVPAVRDLVGSGPIRLLLSPGRVWSEPGDGGMSRASFPFAVVNELHNGTHNGLATFLFDDMRVSGLRVQIVQETASWARVDYWGQLPLTYASRPIADEAALRAAFAEEVKRRAPIRPWSALTPSAALAAFDGDAVPENISANGLVMDGVLYVRGCHTRHGPYPYCGEMRHGVFSVTKSAAGATALLRLAQKYGDGVLDEKITDYLLAVAMLLSPTKLAEALYRTGPTVGLPIADWRNRFGESRYHLSFWSVAYRTSTGCFVQVPYMSGFGGNLVALLPNGVSVFRFADGVNYDLDAMILAGETLRPFCPSPAIAAPAVPAPVALAPAELAAEISGRAFTIGAQRLVFAAGGRLFGSAGDAVDVGTWEISADGRVCRTWTTWDSRLRRCYVIYRSGETFELDIPERLTRFVATREPAAPAR